MPLSSRQILRLAATLPVNASTSPSRYGELSVCLCAKAEPSAKVRTEQLMKASMEYQASGDLGLLQPDTPQNSVRSLLNALLLKQAPNQVHLHIKDAACSNLTLQ